ncbi:type 1 fimbrial protein [Providencia rettgeri]|nr:type 1 fimbrial protein [Providencia rettgeri]
MACIAIGSSSVYAVDNINQEFSGLILPPSCDFSIVEGNNFTFKSVSIDSVKPGSTADLVKFTIKSDCESSSVSGVRMRLSATPIASGENKIFSDTEASATGAKNFGVMLRRTHSYNLDNFFNIAGAYQPNATYNIMKGTDLYTAGLVRSTASSGASMGKVSATIVFQFSTN